jgi:predicted oxidoreductase
MVTKVDAVRIHPDGPYFSRLIYGTWRISDSPDTSTFTPDLVLERIRLCLSLGITTFDLYVRGSPSLTGSNQNLTYISLK